MHLHILGICGTFMGGLAKIAAERGHSVSGCDANVYPPMSDQLRGLGVTSFAQIAAWDDAEIDRIDAQLGRFQGRIRRDGWVEQARLLAAGDSTGFAARFGNAS